MALSSQEYVPRLTPIRAHSVCTSFHPHACQHTQVHTCYSCMCACGHCQASAKPIASPWSGASSRFQSFSKTPQGKVTTLRTSDPLGEVSFLAGEHALWGRPPLPCSNSARSMGLWAQGGGEEGGAEDHMLLEQNGWRPLCFAMKPLQWLEVERESRLSCQA